MDMFKNGLKILVSLLILGISLTSCTFSPDPSKDPKRSLSDYVSLSFSVKDLEDKARLLNFLTGDVKSRLAGWSDDQFRDAFIESKKEFQRLYFSEVKEVSPSEVQITYELTYLDHGKYTDSRKYEDGKRHEAKVTNKKLCQMKLEKGKWLISDVRNIKELVEYKDELSLP
jgi:hypothetical protein